MYLRSNWLTEKSDIYSFSLVLLELITNKNVIDKNREMCMIIEWVNLNFTNNETIIVNSQLHGEFDANSLNKVVDIAITCVKQTGENTKK